MMTSYMPYRATLLVVDDIPTNLKVLLTYLHSHGFKVLVAQDGLDALKKVAQVKPDLILLDIMMPKMDGIETCRRLKDDEATRDIPVIFMTALTDTTDKVRGFSVGGVDYVTKPVQHEEVLARINTHLTLRQLQRTLEQQNQETSVFAQTMANDLKNPLLRISNVSEILAQRFENEEEKEILGLVEDLQDTSSNLLNTVDAMLLLLSVRTPKVPVEPLNMAEVVDAARARLLYLVETTRAHVEAPSNWPLAQGYAPWVEETWINYLSNALKYGGSPPKVRLGADLLEDKKMVRFWVEDNGAGVSPEQREQLFSPRPNFSLNQAKGYGLGLSIVQRMIHKCGGEVGLDPSDAGSRFYFTLPTVSETE